MSTEMLRKTGLLTNHIFVVLLLLVVTACVPGIPAVTPPPVKVNLDRPGGRATYDIGVSVADRYGIDANGNGVVDMPNTVEYVQGHLHVTLNAYSLAKSYPSRWPYENTDSAGFYSILGPWRWTLAPSRVPQGLSELPTPTSTMEGYSGLNDGQRIVTYSDEPKLIIDLFEGEWSIELARMDAAGDAVYWKTADVGITDFLIVQLGDSYSSGEGAPDRDSQNGYWGDDGTDGTGQNSEHQNAHRSSNTWGSVVASRLEAFSASASVTFINLAVSGALIEDLRAQLDQLSALVGVREVDAVLISIGGNDAGFENAIIAYLLREPILDNSIALGPSLGLIEEAIQTGNWTHSDFTDTGGVLLEQFGIDDVPWLYNRRGLNGLNAGYENLANAFAEHAISPAVVYILQYPDPFVADPTDPDAVCPGPVLTSVSSILGRRLEVGRQEQRHARDHFMVPLNQQIAASAEALGWHLVKAERVMYGHAICQDERMVTLYSESLNLQGDKKGSLHPNKIGYEAIAAPALNALVGG